MNHSLLSILYFAAFSHALLLAAALWRRTEKGGPTRLLALVVAVIAYKLFEGGTHYSGLFRHAVYLMDLMPGAVLFIGPLVYFYANRLAGKPRLTPFKALPHFLPAIGLWLWNAPSLLQPVTMKVAMWEAMLTPPSAPVLPAWAVALLIGIKVHLAVYLAVSWRQARRLAKNADQLRADGSRESLVRLQIAVVAFGMLEMLWVVLFAVQQFLGTDLLAGVGEIWLLAVAACAFALGMAALHHPDRVFDREEQTLIEQQQLPTETAPDALEGDVTTVKYINSALPEDTLTSLAAAVEEAFSEEHLYLNDKLSLTDLARATGIRAHTLSQVINQCMATNFYRLVNGYRVQHAAELIEQPQLNWTLERIALESGFSNRVTFSKAFKEVMGCTPSAYKKGQRPPRELTGTAD